MKPRQALITSAAVAATMVSASAAMALNGGILGTSGNDGVGTLSPTMVTVADPTTGVELPDPIAVTPSDSPAVTTSSASTVSDSSTYQSDDSYEDDESYEDHDSYEDDESYEDHDSYEDDDDDNESDHDDEDHEYEGYDHDD